MNQNNMPFRYNHLIESKSGNVRLINGNGEQLGVFSLNQAIQMAEKENVDLIEIASHPETPVCKLLSVGKYKYELSKKSDKQNKLNRKQSQVKEIQFRPNIDVGDFEVKVKQAKDFLESGYKVKVVLKFKGRELKFRHLGLDVLEKIKTTLGINDGLVKIIQESNSERLISCIFSKK